MLILSLLLSVLFLYIWFADLRNALRIRDAFWKSNVARFTVKAILLIAGAVLSVNTFVPYIQSDALLYLFSMLLSAAISFTWYTYLRWIDVFEPERKRYLVLTFVLSCITIWGVFPISDALQGLGFHLDGTPLNDFIYSTVVIGMVEELVKVLPVLIILRFTNQIDEPIDYIIYSGMSALGFAFIENILYLANTNLTALGARLLYASVAHMFFAACIAYPLALYRIKTGKRFNLLVFLGGFLLASLAHGFYDFWLITREWQVPVVTTAFFLGSLHIFSLMKNNLINLSIFYDETIRINRNKLKYDLVWYLLLVIYVGYVFFAVLHGPQAANKLLLQSAIVHVAVVIYIAFTFSSYNLLRGYRFPLRFPFKFFWPKMDGYPDYTGLSLTIQRFGVSPLKHPVPVGEKLNGKLLKRVVLEEDMNWYLFLDEEEGGFLLRPKAFSSTFSETEPKHVLVSPLKEKVNVAKLVYNKKDVAKGRAGLARII